MPTDQSHRLGFAGTPTFAAHILRALIASQHRVIRVWTQPDRPIGRGLKVAPSPVKEAAQAARVPVVSPSRLTRAEAPEPPQSMLPKSVFVQVSVAQISVALPGGLAVAS